MHRRSVYISQQPASVILPHGAIRFVKPNAARSICKGEPMVRQGEKFSKAAVARLLDRSGRRIAGYLTKSMPGYETCTATNPAALRNSLKPGDVLLVEGNSRISGVIKYLTQSTWSHAALYVGPVPGYEINDGEPHVLIEAELGEGVVSSPLSKYYSCQTRICRPVGLTQEDCARVCNYAIERIGFDYDIRNLFDLMRYLIPLPIPRRWRRRMLALGSGTPTRIICSALIAQAFEAVRYPILPNTARIESKVTRREILQIRHSSLYAPRDFDISPYFGIVKPTLAENFNYQLLDWADLPGMPLAPASRGLPSKDEPQAYRSS
jgi:permuted papain-like amidase YaeF/Yiix C92 family enzyme